jgi:hypothetical protein
MAHCCMNLLILTWCLLVVILNVQDELKEEKQTSYNGGSGINKCFFCSDIGLL